MTFPQTDQSIPETDQPTPRKSLRLWPGVVLVIVQWLLWFAVPFFFPSAALFGVLGGVLCALLIIVWWLFLSRAPWLERIGAIVLIVVALIATKRVVHESIAGGLDGVFALCPFDPVSMYRSGRVVSRESSTIYRSATRDDGCGNPVGVRNVYTHSNRWPYFRIR